MGLEKNQDITITIEALSSDGNGIGRHEGMVVFVPHTAPGDCAEIRIVKIAKSHAYGRVSALLTPGPGRREEDCPVSKTCGGCSFRHITYEEELSAKQRFVADVLHKIGGLEPDVPAPLTTGEVNRYRNKVQYPVAAGPDGSLQYGFFAPRSHRLVPCGDCLLQPVLLNQVAARAAQLLRDCGASAYSEADQTGLVRHICLRQSMQTGQVLLCIVAAQNALPRQRQWVAALAEEFPQLAGILLNVNSRNTNVIFGDTTHLLWGEPQLRDTLCGVPLFLGPTSFSQVNPRGAELLFSVVGDFAAPAGDEVVLDLYCGTGVIGLSLAARCRRLIGVEISAASIEAARKSAAEMGLANTEFIAADAAQAAQRLAETGVRPDLIILDPPRKGAGAKTLAAVFCMNPARIVMVSCNPATLARDLAMLAEKGYNIMKIQPVDMFPRTPHVECVCLLERS